MKKTIARLEAIAKKNRTSADDKQFVLDCCEQYGVPFKGSKTCPSCYRDMAVVLYAELKGRTPKADRKIWVREGTYVWNWITINNTYFPTDEACEKLLKQGAPKWLFIFANEG